MRAGLAASRSRSRAASRWSFCTFLMGFDDTDKPVYRQSAARQTVLLVNERRQVEDDQAPASEIHNHNRGMKSDPKHPAAVPLRIPRTGDQVVKTRTSGTHVALPVAKALLLGTLLLGSRLAYSEGQEQRFYPPDQAGRYSIGHTTVIITDGTRNLDGSSPATSPTTPSWPSTRPAREPRASTCDSGIPCPAKVPCNRPPGRICPLP